MLIIYLTEWITCSMNLNQQLWIHIFSWSTIDFKYDPDLSESKGEGHWFLEYGWLRRHYGGRQDVTINVGSVMFCCHEFIHILVNEDNNLGDSWKYKNQLMIIHIQFFIKFTNQTIISLKFYLVKHFASRIMPRF